MSDNVEATCTKAGYDSTKGIMYEVGRTYDVNPDDPWIKGHFEVPDKKKKAVEEK
jgi:hypothetical protein